jgi:predicted phosphodiesterase
MKIKLWSDIHLEFSKHAFSHILVPNPEHKEMTLVLAGDIDVGPFGQAFIDAACAEFKYVLRVFGNHEFYSQQFDEVIADWTKYELEGPKNFHLLHNDTRYLDGVRFIGGTMWTSFDNNNPLVVMEAMRLVSSGRYGDIPRRRMSDYEEIWNDGKVITPEFTTGEHYKFIDFLFKETDKPFDGPTVIVTHHSPGNVIKRLGRSSDLLDHCYYADLEGLIGSSENFPKLWLHGHTHRNADYLINETRVVCNPFGYYNVKTNHGFDRDLVIEV